MKKTMKKLFVSLLAVALLFGGVTPSITAKAANDATAFLMFSDRDWAFGNWDSSLESATTVVNGEGSYSVTLNATEVGGDGTTPANGAIVFCIDIEGAQADLDADNQTYEVTDLSILADGEEVAVDLDKIVAGDIEENGNFRIEIYNEYGSTVEDAPIDYEALAFAETLTVNFSLAVVDKPEEEAAGEEVSAEQTAFLMFSDRDWAFGNWDTSLESATTTVSGDGTYTVTLNAAEVGGDGSTPANGAIVFCVDVVGLGASVTDVSAITVSDLVIEADGEAIEVDADKIVTGDIEENGNFRIEIYNEYGSTVEDSPIDYEALAFADTLSVTFTLSGIEYGASESVEEEETAVASVDLDGTYNAYIGFQTPNYSFRNAFDDATYGRDTEYFNQVTGWDSSSNAVALEGTFTDAVIAGNGTYTVSVDGLNFPDGEFDSQDYMNLIFISTDIPNSGEITISDVELKVNGSNVSLASAGAIVSPDSVEYLNMLLQNIWNSDVAEIGYYTVPCTSMSITFTVSGFNYDAEVAEEPEVTEPESSVEESAEEPAEDVAAEAPETTESSSATAIIVVVIVVVVVAVVAGVIVSKKKKS